MSDNGWEAVFGIGIAVAVVTVILGIASLMYMSGSQTHAENMAMIQSCGAEYAFIREEKVHYITREFCAGSVQDRVISIEKIQREAETGAAQ